MDKKKAVIAIAAACAVIAIGGGYYFSQHHNTDSNLGKDKTVETTKEKDTSDEIFAKLMEADYAKKYVKVDEYKNLDYSIDETVSTDEDLNNQIRYNMMLYTMDKIPKRDTVDEDACVSFTITDTTDPDNPLEAVENKMLYYFNDNPKFKSLLMGCKEGDTFETPYTYKGKEINASIKVFIVVEDPLKYFDNDWVSYYAEQYGEYDDTIKNLKTTDDYIAYVKAQMESENTTENNQKRLDTVYSLIEDKSTIQTFDEEDVKKVEEEIIGENTIIEDYSGVNAKETIMKYENLSTDEEYDNYIHQQAEEKLRKVLLYTVIANQENLMPSDEEWKTKLKEWDENLVADYMTVDNWGENRVKELILEDIVNNWLIENN